MATPITQASAVAELRGWVSVVVTVAAAAAAAVVVDGVTTEDAEETVFITELTLAVWLDITILG